MKPSTYLQRHGWARHKMREPYTGKVCMLGAADACGEGAALELAWRSRKHPISICLWNDTICESKAEAVRKLKELGL